VWLRQASFELSGLFFGAMVKKWRETIGFPVLSRTLFTELLSQKYPWFCSNDTTYFTAPSTSAMVGIERCQQRTVSCVNIIVTKLMGNHITSLSSSVEVYNKDLIKSLGYALHP